MSKAKFAKDLGLRIVQELADLGIKPDFLGKFSNVKKAFTGGKPTFFKPDVLETFRAQDGNFSDALNLMEEEAKYIVNATDAEKMAFLNNLSQYKSLGGPKKTTSSSGIGSTKAMEEFRKTQSELQKALKDLQSTTEKNKNQALKDLDDFMETGGQPFKKKDNKFLGGSMHEESQIRTGVREFLQTEFKNGRLKLNDLDKERIMQYSPMIEHDPILVFKKIYGEDAYKKAGSFPGAFEKGENFKHYEKIFRENMGEDVLKVKNEKYKGDGTLTLTEREEVFKPTPDDDDIPFAEGGRAKYYTGGMIDVEPNLSDIGHGSDSLMARTRLVSPNSQATTSTGLNYLLAEDNDNIRVPFESGKRAYDYNSFDHKINQLKAHYKLYKKGSATGGRKGILTFEQFAPLFAKENFAEGGRIGFSKGKLADAARRKFMKAAGAGAAGLAALKTGLLGFGEKAAPVVEKAVTTVSETAQSVPPYFFNLVKKIKNLGEDTMATQDKANAYKFKDYVMEEDFAGNITIVKKNMDDPYPEEVIMSYKVDDVSLPSGKGMAKVDEYEEFTVRPDAEGKMKDIESGVPDEVVNEGTMFEDNMTEFGEVKYKPRVKVDLSKENLEESLGKVKEIDETIETITKKADGGRIGFESGKVVLAKKIYNLLKNNKKIQEAVNNIFSTGDYKYDASMAAESLVELNPKTFGNKLYDDLDQATQMEIYDAVISPIMANQAKALRMKKASKPTKTLEGIEKTGTINISDPEVAEEFTKFMKETDPEGSKVIEQTVELSNFNPKGRKKNATGGLTSMLGE